MKFYYIANARMPTEKAHGIQIAKMCEAFVEEGIDLTLVVPRRVTEKKTMEEYYGLRVPIKLIRLPVIDWYTGGRIGYFISSFSFMISYSFFLWLKKIKKEKFIIYTVDTDNYSSSALAFLALPLFSEMHGAKPKTLAQKILFRAIKGIIAINNIIVEELKSNFPHSSTKYLVEPNGVDLSRFTPTCNREEARKKLKLPLDIPIVLYVGRFFEWKGLEIVPQAAARSSSFRWQMVGGTEADFSRLVKQDLPDNMFFSGDRPHEEMPLWLAAADTLLVLGTTRDKQSYRYTSPMKLFEYLLAERPIVASRTPAITQIVSDREVIFYEPDNAQDLAKAVEQAITKKDNTSSLLEEAFEKGRKFSWQARASRIIKFIEENI